MITDVLKSDDGVDSTAQKVLSYMAAKGIDSRTITGEMLGPLYASLSKSSFTPLGRDIKPLQLEPSRHVIDDVVWGVIVETREHPALEHVVCQFSDRLGIGIQLFHSSDNESFIRSSKIAALIEQKKVMLTKLGDGPFSPVDYNALFLSMQFWNALSGRNKILIFQTDALLCWQSDYHLTDFLSFDYIGSKWPRKRPVGMTIDGGNGGLSLRDWSKSTECLKRFLPGSWPGGEDGYFAFHIDLIGGRIGRADECGQFSTQCEFLYKSFGAHKVTDLDPPVLEKFLEYCPEIEQILGQGSK